MSLSSADLIRSRYSLADLTCRLSYYILLFIVIILVPIKRILIDFTSLPPYSYTLYCQPYQLCILTIELLFIRWPRRDCEHRATTNIDAPSKLARLSPSPSSEDGGFALRHARGRMASRARSPQATASTVRCPILMKSGMERVAQPSSCEAMRFHPSPEQNRPAILN